jgi:1-deoxyxylulose-5-phosphate synthase
MKYKQLGRTGLKVSPMGLGTMTLGEQVNEADSIELIKTALSSGINFLDTANSYLRGKSEEVVGKAIKGQRDSVVLATKGGAVGDLPNVGPNERGLSRKNIMKAIEGSLRRLQTDYIDLYYAHFPDYQTPLEETLRTMDDLVHQGKVRYIGCSNFRAWMLCKALWVSDRHNLVRFDCVQPPYNLLARDMEYELIPLCASEGVGVVVFNPLAGELLTGRHKFDKQPEEGRFTLKFFGPTYRERYWSAANFDAVNRLKQIAEDHGRTLVQFSLAWILSNPTITSVLSAPVTKTHLEENLKATELVLSEEELKACDEVWHMFRPPRFMYGV